MKSAGQILKLYCALMCSFLALSCDKDKRKETPHPITADNIESLSYGSLALDFDTTDTINVAHVYSNATSHTPATETKVYEYKSMKITKSDLLHSLKQSFACARKNDQLLSHCSEVPVVLRRRPVEPYAVEIDAFYPEPTLCVEDYFLLCRDAGFVNALSTILNESPHFQP